MTFDAQELNTRISLERFESYRDDDGVLHEEWAEYAQAFAKIEPLVGREFFAAAAVQAEGLLKVTLRWRGDIKPSDRVVIGGEPWDIQSAQNIRFKNRELLLYCKRLN